MLLKEKRDGRINYKLCTNVRKHKEGANPQYGVLPISDTQYVLIIKDIGTKSKIDVAMDSIPGV